MSAQDQYITIVPNTVHISLYNRVFLHIRKLKNVIRTIITPIIGAV